MARFYGSMTGQAKTAATRRGNAKVGVVAHIRGWEVGVRVKVGDVNGQDCVEVYRTSGSLGRAADKLIAMVYQDGRIIHVS